MLVSSCPGWTCYAEKTHPQVLPLMSSVKSAQQILGCVLKRYVRDKCKENNADGGKIFLVSVRNPCFDKKLRGISLGLPSRGGRRYHDGGRPGSINV